MSAQHTAGPWLWEFNEDHKSMRLVGGKPQFDLTIIEPTRWGMGGATLLIRDTVHDGMNIMHKLHERRDWIAPFPGRAHHADWCADVIHPDMRLIAAAPDLLAACANALDILQTDRQSLVDCHTLRDTRTDDPIAHGLVWVSDGVWIEPSVADAVRGYDRAIEQARAAIAKATGAAT